MRSLRLLVGILVIASVAACGDDGASPDADTTDSSSTTTEATTTTAAPESALPAGAEDLVGRWAHFDIVTYEDPTLVSDESLGRTLIISTGFADFEIRDDGQLWNTQRFCHADTATESPFETTFSDAATQAIVPVDTPVDVTEVDGVLRVVRPITPTPIGIALDDPANESLPEDPNDPRIFDHDGDGSPGVTASVELSEDFVLEIHLVRREIFHYDVTQVSPDRFEGVITDSSEQLVVGVNSDMDVPLGQWEQVEDADLNPVIWVRVDDTWDCDRLAAQRDALFPPNPPADW